MVRRQTTPSYLTKQSHISVFLFWSDASAIHPAYSSIWISEHVLWPYIQCVILAVSLHSMQLFALTYKWKADSRTAERCSVAFVLYLFYLAGRGGWKCHAAVYSPNKSQSTPARLPDLKLKFCAARINIHASQWVCWAIQSTVLGASPHIKINIMGAWIARTVMRKSCIDILHTRNISLKLHSFCMKTIMGTKFTLYL